MFERDIRLVVEENVRHYMKENNVRRKELTASLGQQTISNVLSGNGNHGYSIVTVQRLAEVLGVKTIDLLEDWSDEE